MVPLSAKRAGPVGAGVSPAVDRMAVRVLNRQSWIEHAEEMTPSARGTPRVELAARPKMGLARPVSSIITPSCGFCRPDWARRQLLMKNAIDFMDDLR